MAKNKPYLKRVLPNGLTVLCVPVEAATSVTMSIFVKAGSRYEEKSVNGISHFLEHLHFKGTKKYPTAKKLSEVVDGIGGEFNANTGKEHTQYYIRADKTQLPLIFSVLTEMLQNPLFDAEEIEREKGVIVEEINMYKDNPQIHVESLFEENMWPDSSLGRDTAGTAEVVRSITRQNILDYRARYYQPKNMIIAVSGNFSQKELDEMINRHWAHIPNQSIGGYERMRLAAKARLTVQNKETEQAHMIVGFPAFAYVDRKNYPLRILSAILGGGMSSRLFIRIRERLGLAYYVGCSFGNYLDTGNFVVHAGLKVEKAAEALEAILEELTKIRDSGVTAKELNHAKEYLKGRSSLMLEDHHNKLEWYLTQEAFMDGKIKTIEEVYKELDKVTREDVSKVAKELIRGDRLNVAIIGPFPDKSIFEKKLK
jgi:predicted Zn-dependent peptidase